MNPEELKKELETLTGNLQGMSKKEIETAISTFERKNNDFINAQVKAVKDELEAQLNAVQAHADKLDVKLQNKEVSSKNEDPLKKAITDNFDMISKVRKGNAVQVKAVGNMTIGAIGNYGGLTGDQPRDYNFNPVSVPSPLINVSDLTGTVNISGGTYTYVRVAKGEGSISAQTEGSSKTQIDYDYTMVDVNTDFIAGFARYSRKMANNLPFLQSSLPVELRRDYIIAENSAFNTTISGAATASSVVITGQNKIEMLIEELATLEGSNYSANGIVVTPADWYDILITEKSTGAGYGLPGVVTFESGMLRVNGIPVYKATWLAANKYYVGDWSRVNKVVTEGLSLEFSDTEGTNFVTNSITARIEAQVAVCVEQPAALIYGDFTAT